MKKVGFFCPMTLISGTKSKFYDNDSVKILLGANKKRRNSEEGLKKLKEFKEKLLKTATLA